VPFLVAVQVHGEGQVLGGLVLIDMLGQQDGIGAQVHELLARHDAGDDLRHLLVDERLTAGDRHHRGAALIDRLERILQARFCRISFG
jgi:hypothetical protein